MALSSTPDPLWSERQELQALQRINHALTATLTLSDVLQHLLTEVVSLFTAQSASVILHPQPGEAELVTTYGKGSPFQPLRYPLAGSLVVLCW